MAPEQSLNPSDYELPKFPQSVVDSWTSRINAVAVVTAFLAGTNAGLLGLLPAQPGHPRPADTALRFFAYSGLFLNLGATLSAILLLIAVASLTATARQIYMTCSHGYPRKMFHNRPVDLDSKLLDGEGDTLVLHAFGIARGWNVMLRHCILCFTFGSLCTFLHIITYLWVTQSTLVAAVVLPIGLFGFVPPFVIFMFYMGSVPCDHCAQERKIAHGV